MKTNISKSKFYEKPDKNKYFEVKIHMKNYKKTTILKSKSYESYLNLNVQRMMEIRIQHFGKDLKSFRDLEERIKLV